MYEAGDRVEVSRSFWAEALSLNPPVDILWLGVDRRGKCL